jgi:hypothetical protein
VIISHYPLLLPPFLVAKLNLPAKVKEFFYSIPHSLHDAGHHPEIMKMISPHFFNPPVSPFNAKGEYLPLKREVRRDFKSAYFFLDPAIKSQDDNQYALQNVFSEQSSQRNI